MIPRKQTKYPVLPDDCQCRYPGLGIYSIYKGQGLWVNTSYPYIDFCELPIVQSVYYQAITLTPVLILINQFTDCICSWS